MEILVLGANCTKCKRTEKRIRDIVNKYAISATVTYTTDAEAFTKYAVFSIPTVIINEKVVFRGSVPSNNQIIEALNQYLDTDKQIPLGTDRKTSTKILVLSLAILVGIFIVQLYRKNSTPAIPKKLIYTKPIYDVSVIGAADSIDLLYNYTKNKQSYEITLLEFGANCYACKMMEPVMEEIKQKYKGRVHVVFYNITKKQASKYANYFNVDLIPCQILLDKEGNEFYRHTDTISVEKLEEIFNLN